MAGMRLVARAGVRVGVRASLGCVCGHAGCGGRDGCGLGCGPVWGACAAMQDAGAGMRDAPVLNMGGGMASL